jgi:hypothetical protein
VPNTFPLGSIPPLTAWEGETLVFNMRSGLGDRVTFTKRATPSPMRGRRFEALYFLDFFCWRLYRPKPNT